MVLAFLNIFKKNSLPKASEVLGCYLKQTDFPPWTSYFVKYKNIHNDHFGYSYFLYTAKNRDVYLIARTGCFPFIKYHCSKVSSFDQTTIKYQNYFFNFIKLINFGLPTLAYGISALFLIKHEENVHTSKGSVKIYFLYKENKGSIY